MLIDNSDFARDRAGWGWNERGIVRSAAQTLRQRGYANLAALGVSERAATALMVQGENPDSFKAIIADSRFASLGAMLRRNPSLAGLNPAFLQTVMWELGRALGRSVDEISPAGSASKLGNCALLVIQNAKDSVTPESDGGKSLRCAPTRRAAFTCHHRRDTATRSISIRRPTKKPYSISSRTVFPARKRLRRIDAATSIPGRPCRSPCRPAVKCASG